MEPSWQKHLFDEWESWKKRTGHHKGRQRYYYVHFYGVDHDASDDDKPSQVELRAAKPPTEDELQDAWSESISLRDVEQTYALTLKIAKKQLAAVGIHLCKQVSSGEYRVSYRVGERCTNERAEVTAYYTDHLDDALETGLHMARDGG